VEPWEVNRALSNAMEFISRPGSDKDFNSVALALYDVHRELNPVYKKYDIGPLDDWRRIPLMPISEFKNGDVGIVLSDRMPFPGVEFYSSGTTKKDKSKHRMYDTEAYRASIAQGFALSIANYPHPNFRVVVLSPKLPNSSPYYMMQYVSTLHDYRGELEQFDGMTSLEAVKKLVESFKDKEYPVMLFGTSLAFYDLMESITSLELEKIELIPESLMIETGGWKGRDIQITPHELTDKVKEFFSLDDYACVREYSMSEISSQMYSWGNTNPPHYAPPEWLKVRMVDPLTQTEVKDGEEGIISFVDLANVWSCPFILTEDIGYALDNPIVKELVLLGRAESAPEKGCSLSYAQAMDS
jgi:hypothetical protein